MYLKFSIPLDLLHVVIVTGFMKNQEFNKIPDLEDNFIA